ncbi:MAG: DUF460 domain-containing protein [Nanoarchaeota archaeon]
MAKALILGIDPGTSVGCCLLDLDGEPVATWSKKEYSLGSLIKEVTGHGRAIAVGTDKRKVPRFVHDAAIKLGSRTFAPEHDLPVAEKKALGKNAHESDAIASALFAYHQLVPLIRRVRLSVRYLDSISEDQLIIFLTQDPRISIKAALDILTSPAERDIEEAERVVAAQRFTEQNFLSLLHRLKRNLRDEQLLKKRIASLELIRQRPLTIIKTAPMDQQLRFKEDRIRSLGRQLAAQQDHSGRLQKAADELEAILAHAQEGVIAKKLASLGQKEFLTKEKRLCLTPGDVLLVESCAEFSKAVIERMHGSVIMTDSKAPMALREGCYVIRRLRPLRESRHFALVSSEELDAELKKQAVLSDIISSYRRERQTQ